MELYQEGMVTDVFRVLEEGNLTYGDLRLLAMAVRDEQTHAEQLTESGGLSTDCAKCDREVWEYHVRKLALAGLAVDTAGSGAETVPTPGGGYLLIRRIKPTRLGRKVGQLLAEARLAVDLGEMKSVDQES
jgi:bacterioferritin-associated ferredoxin